MDKQKMSNNRFYDILNPAAEKHSIDSTEKVLGFEFNSELRELYSYADGTIHRVKRNSLLCLIPFYDFLSLKDATAYFKALKNENEYFYNSEKKYQPGKNLFPFLEADGGDCYWVDLNKGTDNYNRIYWTTTLAQEPDYLFNSLTSMFKTIADSYEKNILFIDQQGIVSCDYSAWGQLAEINNSNLDYWHSYNNPD